MLAKCYFDGDGVRRSRRKAYKYYSIAAALGHSVAINNLAVSVEKGQGIPRDIQKACALYRKAAVAGDPGALNNLVSLKKERRRRGVGEEEGGR